MITQCPECKKKHSISAAGLRTSSAKMYCDHCKLEFDALELLEEPYFSENKQSKDLLTPTHKYTSKHSSLWTFGFGLCLALLAFQVYFFEAYNISQNNKLRPWLEKICSQFNCQLPTYKNLDDFSILHGSFELTENKTHYVFKTTFVNQSAFKQRHPAIKLSLQDFTGKNLAERVFPPQEYLTQYLDFISPEVSVEISLNIAIPSNDIGGYRFELI